jgi:CheY-like chemotaxis protein
MTADAFEDDVQRAFESGMNAHVAKPLNIHAFTGIIKTLDLN